MSLRSEPECSTDSDLKLDSSFRQGHYGGDGGLGIEIDYRIDSLKRVGVPCIKCSEVVIP
jgi:hypothetical protein